MDAEVCELAALVSDGGAARQPLHPDTWMQAGLPGCSGLVTVFVALQDVTADMGPTLMIPRTHNDAHLHELLGNKKDKVVREAELGDMAADWVTVHGQNLPVVRCTAAVGDCVLMDSRLLHCGGANRSKHRRRLAYFSLHVPGNLPSGSTYSMLPRYVGQLRLGERGWQEATS